MKKILFFLWFLSGMVKAQDTINFSSYEEAIQHVFGSLDSSYFPSGILINAAPYDPKMLTMDGTNTDSVVQGVDWLFYYSNINLCSKKRFCSQNFVSLWKNQTKTFENQQLVTLPILNIKGHYLHDSAYYKNQVVVSDGTMADHLGRANSPYRAVRVFCVSPMVHTYTQSQIRFVFPDSLYFSNDTAEVVSITIDFNNGEIPRETFFNNIIEVDFFENGVFFPLIKIVTTAGTYECRTVIKIAVPNERDGIFCGGLGGTFLDVYTEPMDYGPINIVTTVKPGFPYTLIKGEYGVWLGCGHSQITKPFLISAGFNPGNGKLLLPCLFNIGSLDLLGYEIPYPTWNGEWRGTYYETYNGAYIKDFSPTFEPGARNGNNFLDKLREEGYDIIILKYEDGGDMLQDNALLFIKLIETINDSLKILGSKHEIVVSGFSAGAVSTRFALAKMEKDFETYKNTLYAPLFPHHRCRLWISVEGESQGANVSLGFQHHLKFWTSESYPVTVGDMAGTLVASIAYGMNSLNTARQLNVVSYEYSIPPHMQCHPFRTELLNDFNELSPPGTPTVLKGYPLFCRRVGVSQGSGVGNRINNVPLMGTSLTALDVHAKGFLTTDLSPVRFFRSSKAFYTSIGAPINLLQERRAGMDVLWGLVTINFIPPSEFFYVYTNKLYNDWAPASMQAFVKSYGRPSNIIYDVLGFLNFSSHFNYLDNNNGFAPTVSCLDLYHPTIEVPLSSMGDAGLMMDISSLGIFRLNNNPAGFEHPFKTWGFPHIAYPTNKYQVTPYDAVWAVGSNYDGTNKTNHFHVEDAQKDIGYFLTNVEISPEHLFLSNRNINDLGISDTYQAFFEARNKITSGRNIYADNLINPNVNDPFDSPIEHKLSEDGDFIVSSNTDVDFRAGEEIHLTPGFEAQTGSSFHAFIYPYPDACPNYLRAILTNEPEYETHNILEVGDSKEDKLEEQKTGFNIYPNPSSGQIQIKVFAQNKDQFFSLYDVTGKIVSEGCITNNHYTLSVDNQGIYFLKIRLGKEVTTTKIVIQS